MTFGFLEKFKADQLERFKSKLESGWVLKNQCWEWTGKLNGGRYGVLENVLVHRLSYALFVGNFKKTSFICHHCDNTKCYRPDHLYEGNYKTNGEDAARRKRTSGGRSLYKKLIQAGNEQGGE